MELLTIYTHHSEVKVITALSLISTLYSSLQHPLILFSACCVFNSRSLAMVANSRDSSSSRAQVLLLLPPVQNSAHSTTALSLLISLSLSLDCHTSTPSQSSSQPAWGPRYTASRRIQQKTPLSTVPLLL
jgi:NADH:ubiquinone oxidoreductase subunit K